MMFRDVRAVGSGGLGEEHGPHPDFVSTRGLIMPTILIHSPRISRHPYDSERCLAAPASEDLDVVF